MAFIQLVEFTTTEADAVRAPGTRYQADTEGRRTAVRSVACADVDTPDRFVVVAEFASAADGPISYRNLEVIEVF